MPPSRSAVWAASLNRARAAARRGRSGGARELRPLEGEGESEGTSLVVGAAPTKHQAPTPRVRSV